MAPLQLEIEKFLFCNDEELYEKIRGIFPFVREKNMTYHNIIQKIIINFEACTKNRDLMKKEKEAQIQLLEQQIKELESSFSNLTAEYSEKEEISRKQYNEHHEKLSNKVKKLDKQIF